MAPDEQRELLRIATVTLRELAATGEVPPGRPHRPALLVVTTARVRLEGLGPPVVGTGGPAPLYRAVQQATEAVFAAGGRLTDQARLVVVLADGVEVSRDVGDDVSDPVRSTSPR